jgi:hypothetical protein
MTEIITMICIKINLRSGGPGGPDGLAGEALMHKGLTIQFQILPSDQVTFDTALHLICCLYVLLLLLYLYERPY